MDPMLLPLIAVGVVNVMLWFSLRSTTRRMRCAEQKRSEAFAKLHETTEVLHQMNELADQLIAEKRAAWGIEQP